jgi:hypothetical protein
MKISAAEEEKFALVLVLLSFPYLSFIVGECEYVFLWKTFC